MLYGRTGWPDAIVWTVEISMLMTYEHDQRFRVDLACRVAEVQLQLQSSSLRRGPADKTMVQEICEYAIAL